MAEALGLDGRAGQEVALAASELAANLVKHTQDGMLTLTPLDENGRVGMQIESVDSGPGIGDVDEAMTDGFSTAGSLGYGLGTVNRMMDEFDIQTGRHGNGGTHITCRRWMPREGHGGTICPLAFGAAARPHPGMELNGDAFVIKQWDESALVGVIDGLGHGQFAHRASRAATQYIDRHFDRPLGDIFRGVGHTCRATRGVVMALARFDWGQGKMGFASVGNIQVRVFGSRTPMSFVMRRGIVGGKALSPVVSDHPWAPDWVMVLHSDGLSTHWRWEELPHLADQPATGIARELLRALARDNDDATVVVVRDRTP